MDDCGFFPDRRVPICLPSLVSIEMVECHMRTPVLIASMPSLETAIVRVESECCDDTCSLSSVDGCGRGQCRGCRDYYDSHVDRTRCLLLGAFSEAANLELSAYPESVVFIRDLKFANSFDKLKTLVLADWFVAADLSALIWFLHHSPILEKLTLKISKVHRCTIKTKGSCKLPELPVASGHLKLVEIKYHEVDGTVIEILKILTSSGVPLEQINVQSSITSGCFSNSGEAFDVKQRPGY
ncbi:hypothetical protein BS78_05G100700 [Paspalum vaginatum]|nr:hypothetical protein BS78_05G100700 [Paspalum vaginatum]